MKNIIITGVANGVGKAVANILNENNLILVDLDNNNLERIAKGLNAQFYVCNLASENDIKILLNDIKDNYENIDCLINCAGMWISGTTFTRPAFMEMMELAESGQIGTIIVKDHSRLGRNRLVVGQLLEEDFVRLNIRYIAIMDNIDSSKGLNDFLPIQDWFNEMHAKNTSKKVRAVLKNKGESGISLANNVPYGYKKDESDKTKWIVDETHQQKL